MLFKRKEKRDKREEIGTLDSGPRTPDLCPEPRTTEKEFAVVM
jgi:hypothetical protein